MKTASALLKNFLHGNFYGIAPTATSQVASVANDVHNPMAASFTVEARLVIPSAVGDQRYIVTKGGGSGLNGFRFGVMDMHPYGLIGDASNYIESTLGSATLTLGKVFHLAVVYDRVANLMKGYLDGAFSGSYSTSSVTGNVSAGTTALFIGSQQVAMSGLKIDDVAFWKRALGAQEIAARAAGHFLSTSGLVSYWPFDEGTGTTSADLGPAGATLNLATGLQFAAFNPLPTREQTIRTADLYTFTLVGGEVFRWTSTDFNIVSGGNTYSASGPVFERSRVSMQTGLEVSEMDLTVHVRDTDLLGSTPFLHAAERGMLDRAEVKVERAVMPTWGNVSFGLVTHFVGTVATVDVTRISVRMSVRSVSQLLNVQMPRTLFQSGCRHTLYDTGCTLSKAAFGSSGHVNSGSTVSQVNSSLSQANGYFDLGTVEFTSGFDAVDLEPVALEYDFVAASLAPVRAYGTAALTVTRSGNTATRVNSSGLIEIVNANLPRFDYDPVTLECMGLLVEESRLNRALYSADLSQSGAWTVLSQITITPNAGIAPDGTNAANKLTITTSASDPHCGQGHAFGSPVASNTFTFSIWLWTDAGQPKTSAAAMYIYNAGATEVYSKGLTITETATRYDFTASFTAGAGGNDVFFRVDLPQSGEGGAVGNYWYAWGGQLEWSEVATSYIPTTSSTVTRNADVVTDGNAANWVTSTEGTLMIEARSGKTDSNYHWVAQLDPAGSTSGRMTLTRLPASGSVELSMVDDGGTFVFSAGPALADDSIFRLAYAYKTDDFQTAFNGALQAPDTSGVPCTMTRFTVGHANGASQFNGHIRRIVYFRKRLTNAALDAWTEYQDVVDGQLYGVTRSVKGYLNASGKLALSLPLLSAPTVGETFMAYPGCDKKQATCESKFNNKINYGGAPYIPIPETAA